MDGRVVGIDPGLNVTGYAVVEPAKRGPYVVEAGVIRPRGESTKTMTGRLLVIHQGSGKSSTPFRPRRWPWSKSTATSITRGRRS